MRQLEIHVLDQKFKEWDRMLQDRFGRKLSIHVHTKLFDYFNNKLFTTEEELIQMMNELDKMFKDIMFDEEIKRLRHKYADKFECKFVMKCNQFNT